MINNYKIELKENLNYLNIYLEKDLFNIFESKYEIEYLQKLELLKDKTSLKEIINYILLLIENKEIDIKLFNKNLKIIFPNKEELLINKKYNLPEKSISLLIEKYENLSEENKELKNQLKSFENIFQLKNELKEKENIIKEQEIKIKNNEELIEQLNKKIENLEKNKIDNKLKKNIKNKKEKILEIQNVIFADNKSISAMAIFPSGNFISVSISGCIKIFDKNHILLHKLEDQNAFGGIEYVAVKDDNHFITCTLSYLKTWAKKNNTYEINYIVGQSDIKKIEYLNDSFLTCSRDFTLKIWIEKNKGIELKTKIKYRKEIYSFLILEDINKLIISGAGTEIRKLSNLKLLKYYHGLDADNSYGIARLNKDKIIISFCSPGDDVYFNIISLSEEKIINRIKTDKFWNKLYSLKEHNLFLVAVYSELIIYKKDDLSNYLQKIYDVHGTINGFIQLKNDEIASFGNDGVIKIFKIKKCNLI